MSIAFPTNGTSHPRILNLRIDSGTPLAPREGLGEGESSPSQTTPPHANTPTPTDQSPRPLKPDQRPRKRAAVRSHRPVSQRKIEANRANARKSTGPRTPEGKTRSKMNALQHGLSAQTPVLPGECEATYEIFLNELHEELQPRSTMQKHLLPQIARQLWKLLRLPGAESALFQKLAEQAEGEVESWPELLARCFETGDSNPLMRLERYEQSIQGILLRLMNRYYWLKKNHPTTPPDPDEERRMMIERDREARRQDEIRAQAIREQNQREEQKRQAARERRRQRELERKAKAAQNEPTEAQAPPPPNKPDQGRAAAGGLPTQNEPTTPPIAQAPQPSRSMDEPPMPPATDPAACKTNPPESPTPGLPLPPV